MYAIDSACQHRRKLTTVRLEHDHFIHLDPRQQHGAPPATGRRRSARGFRAQMVNLRVRSWRLRLRHERRRRAGPAERYHNFGYTPPVSSGSKTQQSSSLNRKARMSHLCKYHNMIANYSFLILALNELNHDLTYPLSFVCLFVCLI